MSDAATRYLVERHLDGSLSPHEAGELAKRCIADPALKRMLANEEKIRALMQRNAELEFQPQFARRVLARLREESAQESDPLLSLAAALSRLFPRVAVSALSAAGLLMLANWKAAAAAAPLVDALIGLPAQNLDLLLLF
jgi:anti-sigma factor RsiW